MVLAYIDEAGINYGKINKYWIDGPYAIWFAALINEKKYFDIERTFQDLAREILKEKGSKIELHAHDIWASRNRSKIRKERVLKYFEEIMQLTSKLRVPIILGIQQKNPKFRKNNKSGKRNELNRARYSLLTLLEHSLASMNESAIIVSDTESSKEELKNLVFQRTRWRYNPPGRRLLGQKPKFLFEYRSNFILDQLHYVDSKDSILIQYSDHVCFMLKKALEHLYLSEFPGVNKPAANIKHVPVTESTFNAFLSFCHVTFASWSIKEKDVVMTELTNTPNISYKFENQSPAIRVMPHQMLSEAHYLLQEFTPYA